MGRFRPILLRSLMTGAAGLLLLAAPRSVIAGPITFTGVLVNDGSCTPYVNCVPDPSHPNDSDPGNIGVTGSGLVQISGTFGGALLSAAADADAGILRTSASADYDLAADGYRIAFAAAIVADSLTITAPGIANGTAGDLDLSLTLDGTITKSGSADAGTGVVVLWGGTGVFEGQEAQGFSTSTSTNQIYTVKVPFTFGDPFLLTLFMFSGAGTIGVCADVTGCPDTEGTSPFLASGTGAANADFFHTLMLTGLVPKVGGLAVDSPEFSAESGARYTVKGVAPEPGSLFLLGSGLTFFFGRRRNKRSF